MMTIRETVKQALTTLPGNKPFDLAKLGAAIDILCSSDDEFVTYPQINTPKSNARFGIFLTCESWPMVAMWSRAAQCHQRLT
jgi:hypothetical protein